MQTSTTQRDSHFDSCSGIPLGTAAAVAAPNGSSSTLLVDSHFESGVESNFSPANSSSSSSSIINIVRNWATHVPESESVHRKKCIESPSVPSSKDSHFDSCSGIPFGTTTNTEAATAATATSATNISNLIANHHNHHHHHPHHRSTKAHETQFGELKQAKPLNGLADDEFRSSTSSTTPKLLPLGGSGRDNFTNYTISHNNLNSNRKPAVNSCGISEPPISILTNSICEVNKLKTTNSRQSSDSVNKLNNYFSDCDDAIFAANSTAPAAKTTSASTIIAANNKLDSSNGGSSSGSSTTNADVSSSRSVAITPSSKSALIVDNDLENTTNTIKLDIDDDIDCEKLNTNLERAPLLQLSPNKSITLLNKQNSTSLIFTKKDVNPVVHRKRIALVRSSDSSGDGGARTTTEITTALTATQHQQQQPKEITSTLLVDSHFESGSSNVQHYTDDVSSSPKKRHSFHWHSERSGSGFISTDKLKRKQIKSWYAAIASPSVKEATFENGIEESNINYNNLTYTKEPSHLNSVSIQQNTSYSNNHRPNNLNLQEMGHHANSHGTAPVSKYNRFEQLLKNLVGRKVSRDPSAVASSLSTSAIGGGNVGNHRMSGNEFRETASSYANLISASNTSKHPNDDGGYEQQLNTPLLVASPEIKISRTPSVHNLYNRNENCFTTTSSTSTTSLNASSVQQRLWSVVPLLRREGSCTSLYQNSAKPLIHQRSDVGLKKCETVSALTHSQTATNFEPIKAQNRLRHSPSIATCSRCSSILSLAANGSRYSLNLANGGFISINNNNGAAVAGDRASMIRSSSQLLATIACKLCLNDVKPDKMTKIQQCGCQFCTECMKAYVEFEILEGAYEISCPDALCPNQGIMSIEKDIVELVSADLIEKHKRFRLNREIELDKSRTWCPKAGCETVCLVEPTASDKNIAGQSSSVTSLTPVAVKCPTCIEEFCSSCKKAWHPTMTCEENTRRLAASGNDSSIGIPFDTDMIKCCPMCGVPIEKDEGCAQMMCKRCKHVFCWYCLASLDDDFLLRHYDKGPCKNKLGHSRASVVWHRAQVIGIFAGFGILLLVASPLLLLAAPCIVCCKCRMCSSSSKLDDVDGDFDDPNGAPTR